MDMLQVLLLASHRVHSTVVLLFVDLSIAQLYSFSELIFLLISSHTLRVPFFDCYDPTTWHRIDYIRPIIVHIEASEANRRPSVRRISQ